MTEVPGGSARCPSRLTADQTSPPILTCPPSASTVDTTVAVMNRQTDHLVRLVDDLLDVSRISRGKIELKQQRLDLTALVGQAAEAVRPDRH